jgi:hypothetical protein
MHYTYRSYDHYFKKFQRYTTLQAQQWHAAGRKPSFWHLLINPPARFFRDYVVRLGFLDGLTGLQVAMLAAFYSFAKQARLWELHRAQMPGAQPPAERAATQRRVA